MRRETEFELLNIGMSALANRVTDSFVVNPPESAQKSGHMICLYLFSVAISNTLSYALCNILLSLSDVSLCFTGFTMKHNSLAGRFPGGAETQSPALKWPVAFMVFRLNVFTAGPARDCVSKTSWSWLDNVWFCSTTSRSVPARVMGGRMN